MKLEYFADALEERGLLLLYGGNPGEVASLRAALQRLTTEGASIAIHDLPFMEAVADSKLTAVSVHQGSGVQRSSDAHLRSRLGR